MIVNTSNMRKIQECIRRILKEELLLNDMFNTMVEIQMIDEVKLAEMRRISNNPNLYKSEIRSLSKEEIMSNPYLSNITVPKATSNNFSLTRRNVLPRSVTKYGNKRRNIENMRQINSYFICDSPLRFPGIAEGNNRTCWMSVEPAEISSFESTIKEAEGNVLLIGCGLGYVAYMLSRKDNVKNITIVDINEDVLNLFNTYILPQFEQKHKIRTIKADGIEYLRTSDLSIYDYVNVDIWYDVYDMIFTYLKCLEIERKNEKVKFSYWLEDELKECIQRSILVAVSNFKPYGFLADKIANDLVKDTLIKSYEDIQNLIDIKDLRSLLYGWYINHLDTVKESEQEDMKIIKETQEKFSTELEQGTAHKQFFKI